MFLFASEHYSQISSQAAAYSERIQLFSDGSRRGMEHSAITEEKETKVLLLVNIVSMLSFNASSIHSTATSMAPKFTPSFSIPALLAVPNMLRKETSTTIGRRVHTYLPPPPPGQSHSMSAMKTGRSRNAGSSALLHIKDDLEMNSSSTNFDSNVYPSPSRSRLARPAQAKTRSAPNDAANTLQYENRVKPIYYRPLSPPTSDLAMPVDDPDVLVNVDLLEV
ncbi:hypothetical protein BDZ97DRAFT_1763863 [Flammula alnicola]|nr:hypothetical protein BDZ97DRAFT_1763863 [Flammula alnicola]